MARFSFLTAILILWGCSKKAEPVPIPDPPQLPPLVWLQSARFTTVDKYPVFCTLLRDPLVDKWSGIVNLEHRFILYERNEPRYRLEETLDEIRIFYWHAREGFLEFAQIPLSAEPGQSWTSVRQSPSAMRSLDVPPQTGTCSREVDAYRVDFREGDILAHSMWFTRKDGLVRWSGILGVTLERLAATPEELDLCEAAISYKHYGRVDDDTRWAPEMCRGPVVPPLRTSASGDATTHGRKQYYLFARDRLAYLRAKDLDQPEGQIIVKESWSPGGKEKGPLFLMMKTRGDWVYGTALPDSGTLTSSGKIASCVECHESAATRDRLFGLRSP